MENVSHNTSWSIAGGISENNRPSNLDQFFDPLDQIDEDENQVQEEEMEDHLRQNSNHPSQSMSDPTSSAQHPTSIRPVQVNLQTESSKFTRNFNRIALTQESNSQVFKSAFDNSNRTTFGHNTFDSQNLGQNSYQQVLLNTNYQMNIDEKQDDGFDHEDNMVESSDEEIATIKKSKINDSKTNLMRAGKSRGSLMR